MKVQLSNMMFIEILFWRQKKGAELLAQGYRWQEMAGRKALGSFDEGTGMGRVGDMGEDEGDGKYIRSLLLL